MILIFALFIFIQATPGSANSSGIGSACLADAIKLCTLSCPNDTPRPWAKKNDAGLLSPCCPPGMDLVAPPTHNAAYSLTSTQQLYNPGSIVTLSLDVLKKDFKYLGLLLYAVQDDGREIRVGTWTFPKAGSPKFWTPPMCNKKVLMHKHAGVKHIHHAFDFVAPPVGTGRIRFRVLIKHGETNGGSFFWPQAELTMKEGPSLVSSVWLRGDFGQSCAAACKKEGLSCDAQAINDAIASKGNAQFNSASKFVPCARPHISNNGKSCDSGNSPLVSSDDGFCFYRDDGICPPENVCNEKTSKDRRRTCACKRSTTTNSHASTSASKSTKATATTTRTRTTTKMRPKIVTKTTTKSTTKENQIVSTATHPLMRITVAVLVVCINMWAGE